MLNNVPLSERSARPPGGLLFHPPLLLFPRVPRHRKASFFPDFFPFFAPIDPAPLLKRGTLRGAGVSGLPRVPTHAGPPKAGHPRGGRAALPLPKTSLCQPQNLPCRPGRPSRGQLSTSGENLLPPGANGPSTRWGTRSGLSRGGDTDPAHASPRREGRQSLQAPGPAPSHTHTHLYPQNGLVFFFFLSPSPLLHPPMLFFTSAFVCKWQESKLLFLLPLRFKWSWQIKPS